MTTTMNYRFEPPVRPRVGSFSLRWRPCTAANKKALCESGGLPKGSRRSPADRVRREKEEQRSARVFVPEAQICPAELVTTRGKHSAWLSAPRAAAVLGCTIAGRSPHPLPTGGRQEP